MYIKSLNNHCARLSQPCKVVNTLHKVPHNLVTTLTLQGCSKVGTTLKCSYSFPCDIYRLCMCIKNR